MRRTLWVVTLLLATGVALAQTAPEAEKAPEPESAPAAGEPNAPEAEPTPEADKEPAQTEEGPKLLDGMSVLGNQEAPKSLVIVPWKSSELGASVGISTRLDDSRQPVDKEVFMRALSYYEIRSEKTP